MAVISIVDADTIKNDVKHSAIETGGTPHITTPSIFRNLITQLWILLRHCLEWPRTDHRWQTSILDCPRVKDTKEIHVAMMIKNLVSEATRQPLNSRIGWQKLVMTSQMTLKSTQGRHTISFTDVHPLSRTKLLQRRLSKLLLERPHFLESGLFRYHSMVEYNFRHITLHN